MSRENRYVGEIILRQAARMRTAAQHATGLCATRRSENKMEQRKTKSYLPKDLSGPFEQSALYQVAAFGP